MQQQVKLDDIGGRWGALLTQAFTQIITLEAEVERLRAREEELLVLLGGENKSSLSPAAAAIATRPPG